MSRFQPVHLPEDRSLNNRASQTFLRHFNGCPRSAFLYQKHKGGVQTMEMVRGTALHMVCERATRLMLDQGEEFIPSEVVKVITDEVLAELPVPFAEHDYLRETSARWASEWAVDPNAVIACETLFVLEVGGFQVRCKIDFAELREDGGAVYVADYKSSRAAPAFEEVSRKRPDGTLMAKNFQLILYALCLAFGVPVREEICPKCRGAGCTSAVGPAGMSHPLPCRNCGGFDPLLDVPVKDRTPEMVERMGRGVVEIPEPFPVASRSARFDLEFVFPGIEDSEGRMLRRPVSLTRVELEEYRASLAGLVDRVRKAEETGDWPAVISDAACGECPAAVECPIPVELRDFRGTINTPEEAAQAAEVLDRRRALDAALRKELKEFAKHHGLEIRFGDKAWRFVPKTTVRISDRDAMFADMDVSLRTGRPFDRDKWVRTSTGTDFKDVRLTEDELQAERERDERAA